MKEQIPVPALEIQGQIADLVSLESRLRTKVSEYSSSLREYRRALITAAVTGQIDVTERAG